MARLVLDDELGFGAVDAEWPVGPELPPHELNPIDNNSVAPRVPQMTRGRATPR
jgi:hypothetical protein